MITSDIRHFYVDNNMDLKKTTNILKLVAWPFLLFFGTVALSAACNKKTTMPINGGNTPTINTTVNNPAAKKYLALGDSYTIGTSVIEADRFPVQTAALLNAAGIPVKVDIIATNGWTTGDLMYAILDKPVTTTFDAVSLLIGVNNQYQGKGLPAYQQEFTKLVQRAIELADGKASHVFVLSIPDYSVTPFAGNSNKQQIATEIDAFNAANKMIGDDFKVHYLNVTEESRKAANDPSLIASDGLHFSGKEYAVWALQLSAAMQTVLQ